MMKHLLSLLLALTCHGQAVIQSGMLQSWTTGTVAAPPAGYSIMQQSLTNTTGTSGIFNYYRYASPFYASNNITVRGIEVFIKTNGAAISASTIWLGVFSNSGTNPATVLSGGTSTSVTLSTLAPSHGTWYSFTNFSCALTSGTLYHMVASNTVYQGNGPMGFVHHAAPITAPATNVLQSDLSSWTTSTVNSQFAYRIYGE